MNDNRLQVLNSTCDDLLGDRLTLHRYDREALAQHLWYNDNLELIICSSGGHLFQKIAYFWAKLQNPQLKVNTYADDWNMLRKHNFVNMQWFTEVGMFQKLEKYKKVLSVDHPFDKVYLTYKAKRHHPSHFHSINHGKDFDRFMELLMRSTSLREDGWLPVYDACRPCTVAYDFIIRAETMQDDMTRLVKNGHINPDKFKYYKKRLSGADSILNDDDIFANSSYSRNSRSAHYYRKYRDLTKLMLDKLHNAYLLDLKMFNYAPFWTPHKLWR